MFLPLYDDNPVRRIAVPWVTWVLLALNIGVFVVFQSGWISQPEVADLANVGFGLIPGVLFAHLEMPADLEIAPTWSTPLTYAFLHGGWMHLIGNMLFLWVFGDNVEDALGHWRYLALYLLGAVAAGLAHAFAMPQSNAPLIGASGAVSAIVAAYLMLFPRVKLWVLVLMRIPLKISAMWVIGAWILFQLFNAVSTTEADETAWWAHVGGLVAGAVLLVLLKPADVRLFERDRRLVDSARPDA